MPLTRASYRVEMMPLECPHCKASLVGAPVPEKDRGFYGARNFGRAIGIIERDRLVAWRCPDCRKEWPA